jgi:hypothetical protein
MSCGYITTQAIDLLWTLKDIAGRWMMINKAPRRVL